MNIKTTDSVSALAGKPFKAVFPGKYIQSEKALFKLPELLSLFGQNPLIAASSSSIKQILPAYGLKENDAFWLYRAAM